MDHLEILSKVFVLIFNISLFFCPYSAVTCSNRHTYELAMESPQILYVIACVLQLSAIKGFRCVQPLPSLRHNIIFSRARDTAEIQKQNKGDTSAPISQCLQ